MEGTFHQFIFPPRYAPLIRGAEVQVRRRRGYFEPSTLANALTLLLEVAEDEDRRLFAYSVHEEEIIKLHASPAVLRRTHRRLTHPATPRLVDSKTEVVKRWRNSVHGGKRPDPEKLESYLKMIGFKWPRAYDTRPADTLRKLDAAVKKTQRWKNVPEPLRTRWLGLLEYNHRDCAGLRRLTIKAANGLASRPGRA